MAGYPNFLKIRYIYYSYREKKFVQIKEIITFALPKDQKGVNNMLIIDSKDCENIDKALKKYKKKYEKSRILNQLRDRQSFTKPSIRRRTEILKAVYKQQMANGELDA